MGALLDARRSAAAGWPPPAAAVNDPADAVSIVSPYPALRAGLRALLAGEGVPVAAEASSPRELLSRVAAGGTAIFDLPDDGLDGLIEQLGAHPALRPLVLGPVAGAERLAAALAGRAWGYAPRDAAGDVLASAARALARGLVAVDPGLAVGLLQPTPARGAPPTDETAEELTAREREVLALVVEGLANKQIAQRLSISEHTVKFHVAAILAKLGAASRTEASYLAARRGLVAL